MIDALLIGETVLDRGTFMPAAQQVTGRNHVTATDRARTASRLCDDLSIFQDFMGEGSVDISTSICNVVFMVVGHSEEVDEFLSICRGMPYVETTHTERGIRCVIVNGNVANWQRAVIEGNRWTLERSPLRTVFNKLYHLFVQKGMSYLFTDFRATTKSGVLYLEKK